MSESDPDGGDGLDTAGNTDSETEPDLGPGTCAEPYIFSEHARETGPGSFVVNGEPGTESFYGGSCSMEPGREAVYQITSPVDALVSFELVGADPVLYIRETCEDETSEITCNDDFRGMNSTVFVRATAGSTYYVFADSYSPADAYPFELIVTIDPEVSTFVPDGAWLSLGYGYGLKSENGDMTLFELSDRSCIRRMEGPDAVLQQFLTHITVINEDTLEVWKEGIALPFRMERVGALPEICDNGGTPTPGDAAYERDPLFVFDTFVAIFEENYPFFECRAPDWLDTAASFRRNIDNQTSDRSLFETLSSLVEALHDGHVSLYSETFGGVSSAYSDGYRTLLDEAAERMTDPDLYIMEQLTLFEASALGYLTKEPAGDGLPLRYGFLSSDVGYLRIASFMSDFDTYADKIAEAMETFSSAAGLVIDLRINDGGSEIFAIETIAHFVEEPTDLLIRELRHHGENIDSAVIRVSPVLPTFGGEVIVLMGPDTVSAAEYFALAMGELPNVKLIGQPTMGIFSNILPRRLPNGWEMGLSHEIVTTARDGLLFEGIGVVPDVTFDAVLSGPEDRAAGVDVGLDALTAWLSDNPVTAR